MARKTVAAPKAAETPAVVERPSRFLLSSRDLTLGTLLLAALLFVYLPALHGGMLWDDEVHLTGTGLQSLDGLGRIWFHLGAIPQYYPLLHSAFWLEFQLWGGDLLDYHLLNVLLHALSAFLLVAILQRLEIPGAWLAAFLFALHPVQVESVAWISEQKNTLSTVFYLASALVYLRFDRTRRRNAYWIALALFAMALLSKTVTATLPACLLVILWWKRGKLDWRRDVLPLAPWLVLGAAAGAFSAWMERSVVGAQGSRFALSFLERLMLSGRVVVFYLAKLIWPSNLTFIYPHWNIDAHAWWQYGFTAAVAALAVALALLARKHRAPLAGLLFFIGTLVPVLGFLNVYPFQFSYVADHFQYVACLGVIVPAAAALTLASQRFSYLPALLVAVLAFVSWARASVYQDAETLYRDTVARNPEGWMAHNNLAGVLMREEGHEQEAMAELQTVVRLNPDVAEAHINLGSFYSSMRGHEQQGVAEYRTALRLQPNNAEAHNNLGTTLADLPGQRDAAIAEYRTALRLRPDYAEAHNNLGSTLAEDPATRPEAIAEYREALAEAPSFVEAHANLGVALAKDPAHVQEGIVHIRTALRLRPDMQPLRQLLAQIDPGGK
jgi:tetratricopeptide (TPR) repeat protein